MRGGHLCQEDAARRFDGEVISALVLRGVQVSNAAAERSAITRVEHCIEAEYLGRAPPSMSLKVHQVQSVPSTRTNGNMWVK